MGTPVEEWLEDNMNLKVKTKAARSGTAKDAKARRLAGMIPLSVEPKGFPAATEHSISQFFWRAGSSQKG